MRGLTNLLLHTRKFYILTNVTDLIAIISSFFYSHHHHCHHIFYMLCLPAVHYENLEASYIYFLGLYHINSTSSSLTGTQANKHE